MQNFFRNSISARKAPAGSLRELLYYASVNQNAGVIEPLKWSSMNFLFSAEV